MHRWSLILGICVLGLSVATCDTNTNSFVNNAKMHRAPRATQNSTFGEDPECSSVGSQCTCRKRKREQSLTCLKKNCMERLPTETISNEQAKQVVSLLVTRQDDLTSIGSTDLRRLGNVRSLRLFRCRISHVAAGAFVGLNYVERLDLHHNRLAEVPASIRYLRNLRSLNLGGNQISYIEADAFRSNINLEKLILTRNVISVLPRFLPPSLMKLSVATNKLRSLGDLRAYGRLQILNAGNNVISEFPRLPASVKVVHMCGNQLRQKISVKNLPNLKVLSLSNNPYIGDISLSTFSEPTSRTPNNKLTTFRAKNAGVSGVDANAFACLSHLRHVDISDNQIRNYQTRWFVGNKGLRSLQVTGNPWYCYCDIKSHLDQIAYTFSKRRKHMERTRKAAGRHPQRKLDPFTFRHDFGNDSCSFSGERLQTCGRFKFLASACENKDSSEFDNISLRPGVALTPTAEAEATNVDSTANPPHTRPIATTTTTTAPTSTTAETTTKPAPSTTTTSTTMAPTTTTTTTMKTTSTTTTTKLTTTSTTTTTTTPAPTTTTATTRKIVVPPLQTVGNVETTPKVEWCLGDGRKCYFPFLYGGEEYNECTGFTKWCSATPDYDTDGDWDYCKECPSP